VNISSVYGTFSEQFQNQIPGAEQDPRFYASGVSLVAHMRSPLVPAVHFNTRYIETSKSWFGGGGDLTPIYEDSNETAKFHKALKAACDKHDKSYYPKFKKQCDEYFYLPNRQEARGIGGIFYDYLTDDFDNNFAFTKDVGKAILKIYPEIVKNKMNLNWSEEQRQYQLVKRGRYVEFNLLYDRGTKFGLATGGNTEAILMSMPPVVKWP
jgi:coproporphyrinogen III oxidase